MYQLKYRLPQNIKARADTMSSPRNSINKDTAEVNGYTLMVNAINQFDLLCGFIYSISLTLAPLPILSCVSQFV